jgi:hypothetical protein
MTQFLGQVSYVTNEGPDIKAWPCCSSNHQPLTGIMKLLQEHDINADDVVRVEHYGSKVPYTGSLQRSVARDGFEGK